MASDNKFKFDLSERTKKTLIRGLKDTAKRDKVFKGLFNAFNRLGLMAESYGIKKFLSGSAGGSGLRRRTGSLARGFKGGAVMFKGMPSIRVGVFKGPSQAYAGVHEFGTKSKGGLLPDITPRKASALAVPMWPKGAGSGSGKAVTPAGVSRYSSPRDYPDRLRFISVRKGNVVGALYDEGDINPVTDNPLPGQATYLLMRKVSIKPRPFAVPSVEYALKFADEVIFKVIDDLIGGEGIGSG